MLANFHTHTTLCDGKDTPEEMAKEAYRQGFSILGFSGHMDSDIHMDIAAYYREIGRLKARYEGRMEIITGVELDCLYDPACAKEADYIIGSTHFVQAEDGTLISVDSDAEELALLCGRYFGGDYYKLARAYYDLEAQVYERTGCTFIGHFDLVVRFNDERHFLDETDRRYREGALSAMEALVRQGVPFEINTGAVNRGRKKDLYPSRFLLKALHDMGGEIVINSDAHQKELLSGGFDQAVASAISCGFTHTNVLTKRQGKLAWQQVPLDTFGTRI